MRLGLLGLMRGGRLTVRRSVSQPLSWSRAGRGISGIRGIRGTRGMRGIRTYGVVRREEESG